MKRLRLTSKPWADAPRSVVLSITNSYALARCQWHTLAVAFILIVITAFTLRAADPPPAPPAVRAVAQVPKWIWHAADGDASREVPAGTRYFRLLFSVKSAFEAADFELAADDQYEFFLNGESLGGGAGGKVARYDLSGKLLPGANCLGVKAVNAKPGSAALMVAGMLRAKGSPAEGIVSNARWKTSAAAAPDWNKPNFDDGLWAAAKELGDYGSTPPWGPAQAGTLAGQRFDAPPGFAVEQVAPGEMTGSLVRFQFDHLGRPLITREGAYAPAKSDVLPGQGDTFVLEQPDANGRYRRIQLYSNLVEDCQGYFDLLGTLYSVGVGEQGAGIYKQTGPADGGQRDKAELLYPLGGKYHYHGPHQILLGPDARWYVSVGYEGALGELAANSPFRRPYEGAILPSLTGARKPQQALAGGVILRSADGTGKTWTAEAGGFRNHYGFAFDRWGEMWAWDSDHEVDLQLPWYRPNRLDLVVRGGDYGWRHGSNHWPEWYPDSLPAALNAGRGSPTGIVCYRHTTFPAEYHGALFCGDWTLGRIVVVFPPKPGESGPVKWNDFVLGRPMTVTDLDVGPDGNLYFSTGGGNTEGGLYRIRYVGESGKAASASTTKAGPTKAAPTTGVAAKAPAPLTAANAVEQALTQPQPQSAWGVAALARAKQTAAANWEVELTNALFDVNAPPERRLRALSMRRLFGPAVSTAEVTKLAGDRDPLLRAAAAELLSEQPAASSQPLALKLLTDSSAYVRRRMLETWLTTKLEPPVETLIKLLDDPDRAVRYLALKTLSTVDSALLLARLKTITQPRTASLLMIAIATGSRNPADAAALFAKQSELLPTSAPVDTGLQNPFDPPKPAKAPPASKAPSATQQPTAKWDDDAILAFCRAVELTIVLHDGSWETAPSGAVNAAPLPAAAVKVGAALWEKFATADYRAQREIAAIAARIELPAAIDGLLALLKAGIPRAQQIHYAHCLSRIRNGWTAEQRAAMFDWHCAAQNWFIGGSNVAPTLLFETWLLTGPKSEVAALRRQRADRRADGAESLPIKPAQSSYAADQLAAYLDSHRGDPARGQAHLVKARCTACHRFGDLGAAAAPDLSTVGRRFSRQDLLDSLLYPSKVIAEQYRGQIYTLKDGRTVSGVPLGEAGGKLTIMRPDATTAELSPAEIDRADPATQSLMPEGLLNELTLEQIADLFAALEAGGGRKAMSGK